MNLDPKVPPGRWPRSGRGTSAIRSSSTRRTSRSTRSSSSAPGWREQRRGDASRNSATRCCASASRIRRGGRTRIAAQGGINAAKNYRNDGDSVYRLFYDTIKGGDFR